ncbi:MAG: YfiR family protein, partial [Flavobacteriales bacterium]|nr:YfiR family protein [Flavobacteriales bacterium]
ALQKTKGRSTLVITERDGLAAKGAGISFKVVANRQKFEISKGNIETRKMTVGAALLSLAIVVD